MLSLRRHRTKPDKVEALIIIKDNKGRLGGKNDVELIDVCTKWDFDVEIVAEDESIFGTDINDNEVDISTDSTDSTDSEEEIAVE